METKLANRFGMNLHLFAYSADMSSDDVAALNPEDAVYTIDFANETSIELTSDVSWATGEQSHRRIVGFNNPIEGTLKISTQMVTMKLLDLISGGNGTNESNKVTFKNNAGACIKNYFVIKGETVWADENGATYSEDVTLYKVCPKQNYSATYTGDGDPQSLDVEFEILANKENLVMDVERAKDPA